ncbi:hypothetical protein C8J57DRAFT_1465611 [Mycena rebaudengoi]|nr:hypothetical protein C8J57DRAFT_1465611 [Mycena rebaudengoi]
MDSNIEQEYVNRFQRVSRKGAIQPWRRVQRAEQIDGVLTADSASRQKMAQIFPQNILCLWKVTHSQLPRGTKNEIFFFARNTFLKLPEQKSENWIKESQTHTIHYNSGRRRTPELVEGYYRRTQEGKTATKRPLANGDVIVGGPIDPSPPSTSIDRGLEQVECVSRATHTTSVQRGPAPASGTRTGSIIHLGVRAVAAPGMQLVGVQQN